KLSFELAQSIHRFDGIIVPSFNSAKILYSSFCLSNKIPPKIYTCYKNSFNNDDRFFQYRLDYDFISNQILSILREDNAIIKEHHFGFPNIIESSNNTLPHQEINLLAVQTPSTESLRKLLPYFEMLTGIQVNIDTYSFEQIPAVLENDQVEKKYDLVRIDMESLPYFAEKYFLPLNSIGREHLELCFSASIIERFCLFQDKLYAIPFDPSIQMLFYRDDIFNDVKVKRLFYEKNKKELSLPNNFEQFNQLSDFFKNHLPEEFGVKYGSALIVNDEGTLASEFLMRYYALSDSIFMENVLKLEMQSAKKALKQLKAFYQSAKLLEQGWWKDAVELFNLGEIPMLIVYMNHFLPLSHKGLMLPLGVSTLPNNRALMGGGSLAIMKQTQKIAACETFFNWFLDNTTQEQYVQLGGSSAKRDIVENQNITKYLPWLPLALKGDFSGVRENSNSRQEAINLRQAENIIGGVVNVYLTTDMNEVEVVNLINARLSQL
ncbi:TPA: extracellular solute-binding protein, partial [Mannheimia haemolytica]|nr:extracellular solute-binding protein [Mannheimia haemolytica]